MKVTYTAVQSVVQILINKGLAEQDAKDFMSAVFPLSMCVQWQELRPELKAKYPKIVAAVENYCRQPVPSTNAEQLKLL